MELLQCLCSIVLQSADPLSYQASQGKSMIALFAWMSTKQGGEDAADLRRYWSMVTRMEPGGGTGGGSTDEGLRGRGAAASESASVGELKRIIELQPLETPAASAVASRLALLSPPQFSALLSELARDNHAFRCAPCHCMPFALTNAAMLS